MEAIFHLATDLEFDGTLGRDLDWFEGFGVLGNPGCSDLAFEDAKIAEFEPIAVAEFVDNLIEETLDDLLDLDPLGAG